MSKGSDPRTQPLFSAGKRRGRVVPAVRFRCGSCNAMSVSTAGAICATCRRGSKAGR